MITGDRRQYPGTGYRGRSGSVTVAPGPTRVWTWQSPLGPEVPWDNRHRVAHVKVAVVDGAGDVRPSGTAPTYVVPEIVDKRSWGDSFLSAQGRRSRGRRSDVGRPGAGNRTLS